MSANDVDYGPALTDKGSFSYIPGFPTPVGFLCAQPGDRVTCVGSDYENPGPLNDVFPDAFGLMPCLAIKPKYVREAMPQAEAARNMRQQFGAPLGGNNYRAPWILVDVSQSIWLPYAADLQLSHGDGPGPGPGNILYAFSWDRQMHHIGENFGDAAFVTERRDSRAKLTYVNVLANARIRRPPGALRVRTPSGTNLQLDTGPGTYSWLADMALGKWVSLGQAMNIMPLADVDTLEFEIQI